VYIKKLTLKNIKGIIEKEINFAPGSVTIVSGDNGVGKSSIANSLIYVDEQSHNPDMIRDYRKGNEKGEIVIEIGDETGKMDGASIVCTITPDKTARILKHPNGMKIGVAESKKWIQQALKMVCLDPVRILESKPEDQLKVFLASLPVYVKPENLAFLPETAIKGIDYSKHALVIIGTEKSGLIGMLYDERKQQNAIAEDKLATARTMAASIPPAPPAGDWQQTFDAKTAELASLQSEARLAAEKIKKDAFDAKFTAEEKLHQHEVGLDELCRLEMDAIRSKYEQEKNLSRKATAEFVEKINSSMTAALEAGSRDFQPKHAELVSAISQAQSMIDQMNRSVGVVEQIAKLKDSAGDIKIANTQRNEWIAKLKQLKIDLLGELPIKGVEIVDGQIFVDGLPLSEINTAAQYRLVFEMAKNAMGPLGFCVMDDFEKFGPEQRALIFDSAKAANVQLLAAERTVGPLVVSQEVNTQPEGK
jgi:ABC-type cobalamin/Fe3+-siderophores transport system ATPase subunit